MKKMPAAYHREWRRARVEAGLCVRCGEDSGGHYFCEEHRAQNRADTNKWYNGTNVDKRFGTGAREHYENQFLLQEERCAICRADNPRSKKHGWSRDHRHTSVTDWRGILCAVCNSQLRYLYCSCCSERRDIWTGPESLHEAAIGYLETWNSVLKERGERKM